MLLRCMLSHCNAISCSLFVLHFILFGVCLSVCCSMVSVLTPFDNCITQRQQKHGLLLTIDVFMTIFFKFTWEKANSSHRRAVSSQFVTWIFIGFWRQQYFFFHFYRSLSLSLLGSFCLFCLFALVVVVVDSLCGCDFSCIEIGCFSAALSCWCHSSCVVCQAHEHNK